MDANNWRPTAAQGAEPTVETGDWRAQLPPDSRQRIVNKIMEALKRHLPFSGQEGLEEVKKIAVRFEEKIYAAAISQSDYLRKISLKMLAMESKSQNSMPKLNSSGNSNRPPDTGASHTMQPQVHNQGQPLPIPMSANQSQTCQQLLPQNIQSNMASSGVQSSASLTSALPSVSGLSQASIPSVVGQNPSMQNISGVPQSSAGNSMGQGVPSNMFANSQRQMSGRRQVIPPQQQQQSQNSQHYLYQQQLQQQLMKQKFQQGNLPHSLVQSHMQQQQNLLQPTQVQSSQQSSMQTSSVMQPSMIQSANLSGLQQNQPSPVQQSGQSIPQPHQQSVLRQQQLPQQAASIHQQQAPMMRPQLLPSQQQQQLMAQQPNATNMQQNQLSGQQSNIGDMQQQQQQRLMGRQNNLQNLQQQQQQQQLMAQQNNLSSMHQQQLGSQSNIPGLQQQQQLLGTQPRNSSMQTNQHSLHMLQRPKVPMQQQTQQNASNLLPTQGQQSQPQLPQQQLMSQSQIQPQPTQLQQQLGLQQQPNPLHQDMHPGLQASSQPQGSLLQQQNVIDRQKQLYQSQRPLSETSSTSLDSNAQSGQANGSDWREEVYQKIKAMKEAYLHELNEMYQKIATKLQQHDSLPQQPKSEQLEKLKMVKMVLERLITFLQVSKNNILPSFKEKLGSHEKQILNFLSPNRPRKPMPSLQPGQLPQPHIQQTQSQVLQMQSHENQMNPQMQSMSMQGSVPTMQQNNMASLQHTSLSALFGISTLQQNMMNSLQPTSNLDSGQGNAMSSLQQSAVGALHQNPVSAPQQANINNLSSKSGVSILQPNMPLQSNPNMLQHQHLKQQQEQMLQTQQLKQQYQQRQIQQQLLQKQQMLHQQLQPQQQQLHQQAKQQLPTQMQAHQMSQLHQMNDANELKIRQGMGIKPGVFQQHLSVGQRPTYPHQQMKSGASFPISSPQLIQAASPQLSQHSSPQVDQQNLLSSLAKTGTPLQSANSPFVVPSPSTQLAPSPMPGDSEKPGLSSLSNAGNIGQQQTNTAQPTAPSLAIGTPGISASPLLAEFTPDVGHGNALARASGKSSFTEQPLERLIKAVNSISPKALRASVSDMGSVVSMIDRIAGSAPGNGSRATVGEDLVAMTSCRLQARNFITQDGMSGTRKMRRYTSATPLNVVPSAGISNSFKLFNVPETSDLESTATSSVKRPRIEPNHALLEEIHDINLRLIDTVVDISDEYVDPTAAAEESEGTIVKCSFIAVALSPNLKSQYASAQMLPIHPLRLFVPANYPNCSPRLLDKLPVEVSKEYEDLSVKAKSRFGISLRTLSQPMSLAEIARTWDVCAREVISEHAQQVGGGSFSSKYGTWEDCLSTA